MDDWNGAWPSTGDFCLWAPEAFVHIGHYAGNRMKMDFNLKYNDLTGRKSLLNLETFQMLHINDYIEGSSFQRLIKEGYSLFVFSCVKDVWTSSSEILLHNVTIQCRTIDYFCYKNNTRICFIHY